MRRALLLAVACAAPAQPRPQEPVTAIANVAVFDGTGAPMRSGITVIIRGETIAAVGPATQIEIPAGATVIDGRGAYLVPGFWNMHVHGGSYDAARAALPSLLAHGVTGVRDMGMPLDDALRLRRDTAGPHVFVAGPLVQGPLPFDSPMMVQVKEPSDADAVVDALARRGVDFIKIHDAIAKDTYLAVAAAARRAKRPLVGHVPPTVTVAEAIEAGQRSVEHLGGQFLGLLIAASADADALYATTAMFYRDAIARLAQHKEPDAPQFRAPFLRRVLAGYRDDKAQQLFAVLARAHVWQCPTLVALEKLTEGHNELDAEDKRLNQARFERELAMVGTMHAAGVRMLVGTDTPYADAALDRELELFVRAGVSPAEALRAATSGATEFLGLSHTVGTIAVGMRADLVLLAADPIADIKNVRRVKSVFYGGHVVSR
jgi:hypothetical protein